MKKKTSNCKLSSSDCTFSSRRIRAKSFIRKMAGQTQSNLMLCDDGCYYVIKAQDNPQGPNVLANETLGSMIAREIGLPVASNAIVHVSQEVLAESGNNAWFQCADGTYVAPRPGYSYGSRFVGSPEGVNRTTQYIASADITRLSNRQDFLGMLILDVWADHQDTRQAVYTKASIEGKLHATFVDHGQMFGGAKCQFKEASYCFYYHIGVYRGLWDEQCVETWISRIRHHAPLVLESYLDDVPNEWYDNRHQQLEESLIDRLDHLEDLLTPYRLRLKT